MPKLLRTKVFFFLLLLSSMAWSIICEDPVVRNFDDDIEGDHCILSICDNIVQASWGPFGHCAYTTARPEIIEVTRINTGYRFDKWIIDYGQSNCSILNPYDEIANIIKNGECIVKGIFIRTPTLTIGTATGGTSSPSGSQTVDAGTKVKITATPDDSHVFVSWSKATNCPVDDNRSATTYVTVNGD